MQPLQGRLTGMLGVVLAVTLAAANLRVEILDRWSVLLIGLFGMTLLLQPFFLIGAVERAGLSLPSPLTRLLQRHAGAHCSRRSACLIWAFPFLSPVLAQSAHPLSLHPAAAGRLKTTNHAFYHLGTGTASIRRTALDMSALPCCC
jgi:hypothetical protein